jgi:hypothetical protein
MTPSEIRAALAAPFDPSEIHWKPQHVAGNRALAVAYLDARAVMDRLDAVCGLGWSDSYDVLPSGSVVCRLQIEVDGRTIVKTDVGSPSEQPDDGDKMKAAFSDALKRAAIKLGVGRYLYRLPKQWVDYDAQKKVLKTQPQLPAWALPAAKQQPATITEEQARELQKQLRENPRIDGAKFLARYAVKRLSELPSVHFKDAVATVSNPPPALLRPAA